MTNELTDVRCPCGDEYPADSYDAGFIAGSGMCQNCDAALPPKDICTCPSGDGSLRHPCPAHPAVEQAGGDERAAFFKHLIGRHPAHETEIARVVEHNYAAWKAWQARAVLAQPSPAPVCTTPTGENCPGDGVKSCKKCPEQAEAERPDVVETAVLELEAAGWRNDDPKASVTSVSALLSRIVGELRFERQQMDRAFTACINERDAAQARVAELEKQEPVAHLRASDLERLNQPGIAGSAGSLWNGPREGFVPLYAAPVAQAQHSVPETTNEEANSFLRVADAGQFKDNAAAVRTAAMIIRGLLHRPAIMKSIIRHRIGLTPEYEGQWHADMYGEDGEVQHHAEADTPDEAVRAVVALAAAPGKEGV